MSPVLGLSALQLQFGLKGLPGWLGFVSPSLPQESLRSPRTTLCSDLAPNTDV